MSNDLEALLDMAGRHAEKVLVEMRQDELLPTFLMIAADGESMLAPTPWRNEDQKTVMLSMLRSLMKDKNVVRYSIVSEAWAAAQPKGWKLGQDLGPPPSKRPDRKEVVIAIAADKERTISRSWDIVRGEAGSIVKLRLEDSHAHDGHEGRMVNLLK